MKYLLLFLILFLTACSKSETNKNLPNIIFIMADDLGYGDLGCYGQEKMATPHIDSLATEGIRFTQAYAGGPVCTPSRCVLMTGLHNGHTVARDNVPHYDTYLKNEDVTIAEILQEAGYRCGGIGKWSLGDPGTEGDATNQGFDMWYGYQNQDHAHYYFPEYLDDSESQNGRDVFPQNSETRADYSHDAMTERALSFIEDSEGKPFFLYAAYTVPHFASKNEDPDGLAVPSLEPYADKPWSLAARKYAVMVAKLDNDVGRIVDLLDELGLSENTLIIFTSDHGPLASGPADELDSNGPLRGAKRTLYEGGLRVPFIARWPGEIPANRVSDKIITFWDMLPTFAEIAGNRVEDRGEKRAVGNSESSVTPVDGISVLDSLKGGSQKAAHDYLYWDYGHCRKRYDQAVRIGDWKGIRLGLDSPIELYDLTTDLSETRDVSNDNPEVVDEIERILDSAATPNNRYTVGELYTGSPIWQRTDHW
jgi:arylsulfatase A-like enzyme